MDSEKKYWVVGFHKNHRSIQFLVHATQAEIFSLNTRSARSYPLEQLLAGGWTMEDVKTPAQVREELYGVKGPRFEPIEKTMVTWWDGKTNTLMTEIWQ